jgi:hypothetical protein
MVAMHKPLKCVRVTRRGALHVQRILLLLGVFRAHHLSL